MLFRSDPEWIEELNAKEAIEAVGTLIKLQRLSVGLTGQHSSSNANKEMQPGASAEVILRQITRGAHLAADTGEALMGKLQTMLADDSQASVLQEMVLRFNSQGFEKQLSYDPNNPHGSGLG